MDFTRLEELPAILLAGFLAGVVRGFAGFGAALVFVPLAAIYIAPAEAVVLIGIVDGVLALTLLPEAFRTGMRKLVGPLLIGAAIALPVGAFLLSILETNALRWVLCALVLASIAVFVSGWRYRGTLTPRMGVAAGSVAGFMGGIAGFLGPAVMIFLASAEIPARKLRGTIILFIAGILIVGAVTFALLDLIPASLAPRVLTLAPVFGLGMFLGTRLFRQASEQQFRSAAYALITLATLVGLPVFDAWLR